MYLGAIIITGVALLAGCASYSPAPISPAQSAEAIDSRSLDDPRLQKFLAAALAADDTPQRMSTKPRWDLGSLTLAAVYYHPQLDLARAKLAEAQAGVTTASQIPNPSLSFEDLAYNTSGGTPSPWTIAPVINFLIETFGKREHRTEAAQALAEAAHADLTTASWQVRQGVRNALLDLWAAQRRLGLLRQRLGLQDQLANLLEHRLAAGEASALDVARERTARNQLTLAERDAERQGIDARTQLAAAIGVPLAALEGIALSFDTFEKPAPLPADTGALRRAALVDRSEIQSLLAAYAAAEATLALQIANQYPNLTLSPGYSYDAGQNKFLLLPAAELPIFNQNQGPIAEALARRQAAAAHFTARQTEIIDAIDGAAAGYRAAAESFNAADVLWAGEVARERRVSRSFAAGQIDRPVLLTAEIERVMAEQSRFDALVQQRQALGRVEDALQHPFFGPALPPSPERNPRLAAEPAP
jgi:outer membrane protein TolC